MDHALRIDVDGQIMQVTVPHNFATLGWVLREARAKFTAAHEGGAGVDPDSFDALARGGADGERLDLGIEALTATSANELLFALPSQGVDGIEGVVGGAAICCL